MSEEKLDLSIEDIELDDDDAEKPIDRLKRNSPIMADFIQAYKDEMKTPQPTLGMIGPGWTPIKLEFKVEQFKIGTADILNIDTQLRNGWDIWQFCNTNEWLIIFFHRKVDKVDSSLDSQ